jgi:uncharacterized membrane protein YoaK (UPF0700 family)
VSFEADSGPPGSRRERDALLFGLALAAGVADAICLTTLGVFTAAVTANVVLVGISLGDGDPHTAVRAALAFAGFAAGAYIGARILGRPDTAAGPRAARTRLVLAAVAGSQVLFLAGWLIVDAQPEGIALDLLAVASAFAMGGQTASASVWHPGVTTTFVTGTLTNVLSRLAGRRDASPQHVSELIFVAAIATGATVGMLVLTHARDLVALIPVLLTVVVVLGVTRLLRGRPRTGSEPAAR